MPEVPGYTALTVDCGDWLRNASAQAGPPAVALADTLLATLADLDIPTRVTVHVPLPGIAPADAVPADPVRVLEALTAAVQASEAVLAGQHLAVASGQLESGFVLGAGAGGRATARVSLRITPRPYL